MQQVRIASENKNEIVAQIYEADKNAVLIIASATGVKQGFYRKFAEFVATHAITVITFDYAGIGLSIQHSAKRTKTTAIDWGRNDLESIIQYSFTHYPSAKITLLGHSIGGQVIGLARSSPKVDKIILVAAQSGYWKFWKGKERLKMWLNWHILFPVMIGVFGYMPSKRFSGMENLPKGMAEQWSRWGRNANYLFDEVHEQDVYYKDIATKAMSLSVADDLYAPREAVDWLIKKYVNTDMKSQHVFPKDYQAKAIGHFGIFRDQFRDSLWQSLLREIEQ